MEIKKGMLVRKRNGGTTYLVKEAILGEGLKLVVVGTGSTWNATQDSVYPVDLEGKKISEEKAHMWAIYYVEYRDLRGSTPEKYLVKLRGWLRNDPKSKAENYVYRQANYYEQAQVYQEYQVKYNGVSTKQPTRENEMKKTINKLNGLKLGEEKLVELSQDCSQVETVNVSLFKLIKDSDMLKAYNLGTKGLLKNLRLNGESIEFQISVGEVEREGNQALLTSIKSLIDDNSDSL